FEALAFLRRFNDFTQLAQSLAAEQAVKPRVLQAPFDIFPGHRRAADAKRNDDRRSVGNGCELVDDRLGRIALDDAVATGTVKLAEAGKQAPQAIVALGHT